MMSRRRNLEAGSIFVVLSGFLALLAGCSGKPPAVAGVGMEAFVEACLVKADAAARRGDRAVSGVDDDWLFLGRELNHLATGRFWEKDWSEVAANGQDPAPTILAFRDALRERGIELILVPVPPKGAIYPEHLVDGAVRSDAPDGSEFVRRLKREGLEVIDLRERFFAAMAVGDEPVYCLTDSHWSPAGAEVAAMAISEALPNDLRLPKQSGGEDQAERARNAERIWIRGDLLEEGVGGKGERRRIRWAGFPEKGGGWRRAPTSAESPVLLLGDSHLLVYHEGAAMGMHADRGGFVDHVQGFLRRPVDLVAVRGSGLVAARRALLEHASAHPGYWEGKEAVVWCFSEREFTQLEDALREIPLER